MSVTYLDDFGLFRFCHFIRGRQTRCIGPQIGFDLTMLTPTPIGSQREANFIAGLRKSGASLIGLLDP